MPILKLQKLILFFAFIGFVSCTTSKLRTSSVQPDDLKNLHYFEPVSFISYIEKGNNGIFNEKLSLECKNLTDSILFNQSDSFRLSGKIKYKYDDDSLEVAKDLMLLVDQVKHRGIYQVELTETIRAIMNENNTNYAMGIFTSGFVRKKGNYAGQILKSIGIGIITLGMYYPIPIRTVSYVYVFIFDASKNEIAFYRNSFLQDRSPLGPKVIEKQLGNIFKGYFY